MAGKMTRKQALLWAIEVLDNTRQTEETAAAREKLEECIAELPFTRWSERAIFDACDQFLLDHGRPPSTRDFAGYGLPGHRTIQERFGMTAAEFRNRYYSKESDISWCSSYRMCTSQEIVDQFVEEYHRLRPTSNTGYNKERDRRAPTWQTAAKQLGVRKWSEMKQALGLETYRHARGETPEKTQYRVSVKFLHQTAEVTDLHR